MPSSPHSKPRLISLFSGAGGLDIGFHNAGFETAVLVEMDPSCCRTLRANMPGTPVIEGDITSIPTSRILEAGRLKPLEAALVVGGPPCQSFSLAGKRMGLNDPRGRLVLEFIRVVRDALPAGFVMENVRGLANWAGGKALEAIIAEATLPIKFKGKTYRYSINYKILNAADYGAPQFRERIIIVGNRLDKNFEFPVPQFGDTGDDNILPGFPKLHPYHTVGEAILGLPPAAPPSELATRISCTIKARREKYGY